MSVTDPSADGVQPEPGQGDGGTSGGQPYADYLNRLPEEVRGDVEPVFKDWNSNVNSRFEEHATYRKQWEPYEQLGLNQRDPEQVSWALQVAEAAQQNPQALREWLDQTYGPAQAQPEQQPQDPATFDPYDPNAQFESLLSQRLGPLQQQLEQFSQWQQNLEQQQHVQHIDQQLNTAIEKLSAEHGSSLPAGVEMSDVIERFGNRYATPGADPGQVVASAWRDYQAWSNSISTAALQSKVDQPGPAVAGGTADLTPEQPRNLREANALAMQQFRASSA